ncbi:hypothetical protein CCS01_08020 [Rhodopila globiformis]|uniref:Uncharacterized protein n=1 Tax=Rhodopila globiformis TaxID=1071 RepID=A0A2S6NK11_RHOGL|nr:hypothetical protein CCS01_08020 [Rhodopila globiformis]
MIAIRNGPAVDSGIPTAGRDHALPGMPVQADATANRMQVGTSPAMERAEDFPRPPDPDEDLRQSG